MERERGEGGEREAETRRERRESSPIVLKAAQQEEEGDTDQESETVKVTQIRNLKQWGCFLLFLN